MRSLPLVALPPATVTINANGLHSYSNRSLPFGLVQRTGVHKDAAFDQDYDGHRPPYYRCISVYRGRPLIYLFSGRYRCSPALSCRTGKVSVVDRIDLSAGRTFDIRMTQCKFTNRLIESKAVYPAPGGVYTA